MTSATPQDSPPKDEIPLEDIDRLLAEEDPEFAKDLEAVRSVETDSSVVIEASAVDETMVPDAPEAGVSIVTRIKARIAKTRAGIVMFRQTFKLRMIQLGRDLLVWLKVRPKEYAKYSAAVSVKLYAKVKVPVKQFAEAPRLLQLSVALTVLTALSVAWVFRANLHGIWIPHLTEPILTSLEAKADFTETFDIKDGAESFYAAFPQEIHELLFKKMKVNLRRTSDNPNPMGAFEVVVDADSKDTAVELRDREVEFHDQLQRLFEEEDVNELDSETGKKILKGRIKKELNGKLTQGWIKDVHFKTFVLKP